MQTDRPFASIEQLHQKQQILIALKGAVTLCCFLFANNRSNVLVNGTIFTCKFSRYLQYDQTRLDLKFTASILSSRLEIT